MRSKFILIILSILMLSVFSIPSQAAYIPIQYQGEAKDIKNDIDLYDFGMRYNDQHWGMDILRQLAMQYTNDGRIESLIVKMESYKK